MKKFKKIIKKRYKNGIINFNFTIKSKGHITYDDIKDFSEHVIKILDLSFTKEE